MPMSLIINDCEKMPVPLKKEQDIPNDRLKFRIYMRPIVFRMHSQCDLHGKSLQLNNGGYGFIAV